MYSEIFAAITGRDVFLMLCVLALVIAGTDCILLIFKANMRKKPVISTTAITLVSSYLYFFHPEYSRYQVAYGIIGVLIGTLWRLHYYGDKPTQRK